VIPAEQRPPSLRLRQGIAMLGGALLFAVVVGPGPERFFLTPLGIGLVYLLTATVGGRRGGYWATATVLVGWGAAVVWAREGRPDLDIAGLYLAGAGLGAVVGAVLSRSGFAVSPLGLGATVAIAGLFLAAAARWPEVLEEARTYALLVGLVGLANAVAGALGAVADQRAAGDGARPNGTTS
jgi:hypothetical protein